MQLPSFQLLLERMSVLYSANMSTIQLAQVLYPTLDLINPSIRSSHVRGAAGPQERAVPRGHEHDAAH